MRKKWNMEWILLVFGLLLLAVVVGSLLRSADPGKGTPTSWKEPVVSTATAELGTGTPGWWEEKDIPPAWPTEKIKVHETAEE